MLNNKNKNIQKNSINQALSQDSYDKFISKELLPRLCQRKVYSKSQETVAKILGVSIITVERIYSRLREDPRFFVGKALRRPRSKLFFTIKVSISKKSKTCLSEYEGERTSFKGISLLKKQASPRFLERKNKKGQRNRKIAEQCLSLGLTGIRYSYRNSQKYATCDSCQRAFKVNPEFGSKPICRMHRFERWKYRKAMEDKQSTRLAFLYREKRRKESYNETWRKRNEEESRKKAERAAYLGRSQAEKDKSFQDGLLYLAQTQNDPAMHKIFIGCLYQSIYDSKLSNEQIEGYYATNKQNIH